MLAARKIGPARTPERAALAEVIARVTEAQSEVSVALKAEELAFERLCGATSVHDQAAKAIADAQGEEVAELMAQARAGHQGAPPAFIAAARRKLTEAEDALGVAQSAHAGLKAARLEAESRLSSVRGFPLGDAVAAVIKPGVESLIAQIEAENAVLTGKRAQLRSLVQRQMVGDTKRAFDALAVVLPNLTSDFHGPAWRAADDGAWSNAAVALQTDPDAALPL